MEFTKLREIVRRESLVYTLEEWVERKPAANLLSRTERAIVNKLQAASETASETGLPSNKTDLAQS
jgi:hypothetical protein